MRVLLCFISLRVTSFVVIVALMATAVRATHFQRVTGEPGATTGATINADGSLTESGVNYTAMMIDFSEGVAIYSVDALRRLSTFTL